MKDKQQAKNQPPVWRDVRKNRNWGNINVRRGQTTARRGGLRK